ncbi:MAG: hypothetical protein FJ260_01035 [Planctomycetes bacterium]|nr:hypothetical protein [Planctomycetota bacterium]
MPRSPTCSRSGPACRWCDWRSARTSPRRSATLPTAARPRRRRPRSVRPRVRRRPPPRSPPAGWR